jgi:CO dehydrogenase maturation factor
LIAEMTSYGQHTVTDMEAGLEHLKRGTAQNVDVMLVVAEPYYRSLEAAARTCELTDELGIPHTFVVANKVQSDADQEAITSFCNGHGLPILGTVPYEEQFMEAERAESSPFDYAPDCAGMRQIEDIVQKLYALEISPRVDVQAHKKCLVSNSGEPNKPS